MKRFLGGFVLLLLPNISAGKKFNPCAPTGPSFPIPSQLSSSDSFQRDLNSLSDALKKALESSKINGSEASFSLNLFNVEEDTPIWETHRVASEFKGTLPPAGLDGNTVYRVASITKLLTIYTWLIEAGPKFLDKKIINLIPELKEAPKGSEINVIEWPDITLGALAAHMAGVPRFVTAGDLGLDVTWIPMPDGILPPLPKTSSRKCGYFPTFPMCSRDDFLEELLYRNPVFPPFGGLGYTNTGYTLLGIALERLTGKPLEQIMKENVFDPLELSRTSLFKPDDDSLGIIPVGPLESFWGVTFAQEAASIEAYSSANDLARFGRAILNFTLLSPSDTRRWMKPMSHTGTYTFSVGAPWEIFRAESNRIIDLFTKSGNVQFYTSLLYVLPDYNAGFTILIATPGKQPLFAIAGIMTDILVPALENEARRQAEKNFAGTYGTPGSSIVLKADDGYNGIGIIEWTYNGRNVLDYVRTLVGAGHEDKVRCRLFPTGLTAPSPCPDSVKNSKCKSLSFRVGIEVTRPDTILEGDLEGVYSGRCDQWISTDGYLYNRVAIDDFIIQVEEGTGKAVAVNPRAWRINMTRR